jgi:hypothetical protein
MHYTPHIDLAFFLGLSLVFYYKINLTILLNKMRSKINTQDHPFHLVDPSPWPFTGALGALTATIVAAMYMHNCFFTVYLMILGLLLVLSFPCGNRIRFFIGLFLVSSVDIVHCAGVDVSSEMSVVDQSSGFVLLGLSLVSVLGWWVWSSIPVKPPIRCLPDLSPKEPIPSGMPGSPEYQHMLGQVREFYRERVDLPPRPKSTHVARSEEGLPADYSNEVPVPPSKVLSLFDVMSEGFIYFGVFGLIYLSGWFLFRRFF